MTDHRTRYILESQNQSAYDCFASAAGDDGRLHAPHIRFHYPAEPGQRRLAKCGVFQDCDYRGIE